MFRLTRYNANNDTWTEIAGSVSPEDITYVDVVTYSNMG